MTDTHTHIYDSDAYAEGSGTVIERALADRVNRFVLPNVNTNSVEPLLKLHNQYPDCTYVAAGLHPCDAEQHWQNQLDDIISRMYVFKPVAIGETGMDLYWDKTTVKRQKDVFAAQILLAKEKNIPLIIHCRDALDETLDVLNGYGKGVAAVFHSFTGSVEDVKRIRTFGDYFFGINGVVTFKNAMPLREALPEIGIERILLETDSPYLAPVPYRGRRNESKYITEVCTMVANILNKSIQEVENITDSNADALFGLTRLHCKR